jgi:hypothetical protein
LKAVKKFSRALVALLQPAKDPAQGSSAAMSSASTTPSEVQYTASIPSLGFLILCFVMNSPYIWLSTGI